MKNDLGNINLAAVDQQSKAFFSGGEFVWNRSEAAIWANLETRLVQPSRGRVLTVNFSAVRWAVAASVIAILSLTGFMRFYTVQVESSAGQHLEAALPDGSHINLNAESSVSYHPYWWKVQREVKLSGEAFFEVTKGRKFAVESAKGTTQVLGTSFNIYARADVYNVTCVTGTVKVKSALGYEAIIKPNSKAIVSPNGKINVLTNIETFPEISWRKNIFLFTATPVRKVFREIERQYGVKIDLRTNDESLYTGNFSKQQNVEEILNYVCPALGLKFNRESTGKFVIYRGN